MINCFVRADSICPWDCRITTLEVTMPRFILAQFNTHRMFSRNAASSRAIPTQKMLDRVKEYPFVPEVWGTAQRGMIAGDALPPASQERASWLWNRAKEEAIAYARELAELGVAKEHANRLLEPFSWVTVLVTATEWDNFFRLRLHHAAQPEMQQVAKAMHEALEDSSPRRVGLYGWHLPFADTTDDTVDMPTRLKVATARCARISYTTHDGEYSTERDVDLHDRLWADKHLSPFEHCARVAGPHKRYANFTGWQSYRSIFEIGERL